MAEAILYCVGLVALAYVALLAAAWALWHTTRGARHDGAKAKTKKAGPKT